ncbi:succinyl-diaminopimelate desuccinylase [Metabacillus crassostreae]|uniref:dipeptidase PepV n=1 Tax=Metabacillus crassostreae TaxID=929098 RepID=UPI00195A850C|nr:dipeptidase PepV [Metabacillus crassostreae]MBM7606123.1 succinyl-diaminopimelate desuccinylase [Metabacillus crassostreae]
MNWNHEVEKRKQDLIKDTQSFLKIKSVLDEDSIREGAPFGEGINEAFSHLLKLGEKEGFQTKNLDGYAGHIELQGSGEEIVGVLCHVDVVPEGDGWTSDPYGAEIRDGKIFARGAMDDKGPTIAAFYAMKIVKDLGLPLTKNVRMIIGTDEESDWRCVEHYFKHEKMPELGFAPDADFPIIFAEKGIIDLTLKQEFINNKGTSDYVLESFNSGRRFNMVPDLASAVIKNCDEFNSIEGAFKTYIEKANVKGRCESSNDVLHLEIEGVSAHAMEPNNGVNAGLLLAEFLSHYALDSKGSHYIKTIVDNFSNDTRGEKLNIAVADEISGELTVNAGVMSYQENQLGTIGVNIRYPVTGDSDQINEGFSKVKGFKLDTFSDSKPHHVEESNPLIQTLKKVYEEQTGEKAELIAIGGGTYARSLEAGVAFGPLFPGRPDVAHQKDEHIIIEDLLKATAIYAQAIYELAK